MDQALAEAKVEISPSSKVWEPQRAYEKRLSTIQAKENRKSLIFLICFLVFIARQLKHPRRRGRRKRVLRQLQLHQAAKRKAKQNGHKTKVPQLLHGQNRGELRGRIRTLIPQKKAQATNNMLQSPPKLDLARDQRRPLVAKRRRRQRKLTRLNHQKLVRPWMPLHPRKVQWKPKTRRHRGLPSNVRGQTTTTMMMMKSHLTERLAAKRKESLISKSEENEFGTE